MALSIGNYGMQSLSVEASIRLIGELGFDGLELCLLPDWDSAPAKLSADRRRMLRRLIDDSGLALVSLMEDLHPSPVAEEHQKSLERFRLAAELGHDLAPNRRPLIQTVLGGGVWNDRKELFRDRVGDWLSIGESTKTIIAIKPHRSGAMSQPAESAWLFEQLGRSRWLGMVYDYSHYAFRDLSIAETVKTAFPFTAQIAVKDAIRGAAGIEFALPGESGKIDFGTILTAFDEAGYRGSVCCEVSSQVFRRSGYDASEAARACYDRMNTVFEEFHLPRRRPSP